MTDPSFPNLRLLLGALAISQLAWAQVAPDGGTSDPDAGPPASSAPAADGGTSDADLAEIEQALRQDYGAGRDAATDTTTTPRATSHAGTSAAAVLQSMAPDISLIADVAAAWFTSDFPLQTGADDPTATGFNFGGLELVLAKAVDPYFRMDAVLAVGLEGAELEEAYATTLALPYQLQARAGQFLTRFGRMNPQHPHVWELADQPFALGRMFGPEGNRAPGVELSWLTPLPWYVEVVGAVNTPAGPSYFADEEETAAVRTPLDLQAMGAIKQFFSLSDDLSLAAGVSALTGPSSFAAGGRSSVYGADLYLKFRPLSGGSRTIVSLQSEWLWRTRDVEDSTLFDHAGYLQLFYRFEQRWGAALRYEYGGPAAAIRGALVDDPVDAEWTGSRHRVSGALTFWPTEFSRLRLQTGADMPAWRTGIDWSVMLAFEFSAGVHGAHTF